MNDKCIYQGYTPLDNKICNCCPLFLCTCIPIASEDGYAFGSEYDCYLCEGCMVTNCINKQLVNI